MSDQLGSVGTTTNGNHPATDAQPTSAESDLARAYRTQSVDERLESLMQTIRTWDWRSSSESGPPSISEGIEPLASAQISSASARESNAPEAAPPAAPDPHPHRRQLRTPSP